MTKNGLRITRIVLLAGLLLLLSFAAIKAQAQTANIAVLRIDGVINPVSGDYIKRGFEQAQEAGANIIIIEMDTPGGLDTSMRDIVQDILNSKVPVVVYVSPSGARAASAGVFITMAAHVAAMAPNTAIGAAHPVQLGGEGQAQVSKDMEKKILNDAVAYIKSIAESHGRNADWAEDAVRKSVSVTEREALDLNVIDLVAPDLDTLVSELDGREVTMLDGSVVTLHTKGATINHISMSTVEDFLYVISDPTIAFILLSLATLGIMVEISSPGLIFPGVVGGISLILAFYSLGTLPVNWAGVLLIVLAFGLFVGEVLTTTFGLFTAGGVVALVLGALILFPGGGPLFRVNPWVIGTTALIIASVFAFVISRVLWAHRRQASTGKEELAGKTAVVKTALKPEGTVFLKGELWTAISENGPVEPGEEVIITRVDGLVLRVSKKR